jgi:hypothetical protein
MQTEPVSLVRRYRAAIGPIVVVLLFLIGMWWSPFEPHAPPVWEDGVEVRADGTTGWIDADWRILESTLRGALATNADTLPMGELMAAIGQEWVGTAYVPGTLEVEGPERLVINLRGLDCVTFVENVYATARILKQGVREVVDQRAEVEVRYARALTELRYRGGRLDGYPSRLHYFSDWIADNAARGSVEDITVSLGGVPDPEPIGFMSTHRDAYRQLADEAVLEEVRRTESRLSQEGRAFVPQNRIAEIQSELRNGDIVAATSTIEGLDVAHTGLVVWVDGSPRLLHAPLVGEEVEISPASLAERIGGIATQDGIIVARPLER